MPKKSKEPSYEMKAKHLIYDLYECECKQDTFTDMTRLLTTTFDSIRKSKNTMLKADRFPFLDNRAVVLIALNEGHLIVSTYKDYKYVSIDIYSVGAEPSKALAGSHGSPFSLHFD